MGLLSATYNVWKKQSRNMLFFDITKNNKIDINFEKNIDSLEILKEIFYDRCYSDYFPFYTDSIIVDIGAHKGYFSIFASRNLSQKAKIISYEPSKDNFNIMNENLHDNAINNVKAFNIGIYSEKKEMVLYISKSENNSIFDNYSSFLKEINIDEEKVNFITIEDIFKDNNLESIDFLKIDAEGSEYPILFNCNKENLKKIKTISVEFHDLKNKDYSGLSLVRYLESNNFKVVKFIHEPSTIDNNFGKIVAVNNF